MVRVPEILQRMSRKIKLAISRCIVQSINDDAGLQQLQVSALKDEVLDLRSRLQEYGFTSHPKPGAEAVVVSIGGNRSNTVIIAVDDRRYRLTGLAEGEVALYDDQGQVVHIKRNGLELKGDNILLETDGVCRIDADKLELHGRTYMQDDVAGLGKRRTHSGGAVWQDDTYTDVSTINATEHGLDAPDIPSSHPEAS